MRAFWRIQQWFLCVVATLALGLFCALSKTVYVGKFVDVAGTRHFYLDGASSRAIMKSSLSVKDVRRVKGESVSFANENNECADTLAEKYMQKYDASLIIKEECADVDCYYAYTGNWTEYVLVDGKAVNLHIAVSKDGKRVTLGYPIIFGGF